MKHRHILTTDHKEIIASIWAEMPQDQKDDITLAIAEGVMELHGGALPVDEVVKSAWCVGFHFCMIAMEQGCLVKAGPGRPIDN